MKARAVVLHDDHLCGKYGSHLTIIIAYKNVCKQGQAGLLMVTSQQQQLLEEDVITSNASTMGINLQCMKDLLTFVNEPKAKHQLLYRNRCKQTIKESKASTGEWQECSINDFLEKSGLKINILPIAECMPGIYDYDPFN